MTAYVANHEKKKRIFKKRETELVHLFKVAASDDKLFIAAERVREAKIGVFKCRFVRNNAHQPHKFSAEKQAANNTQIEKWLSMTTDEIIDAYRSGVG